MDWKLKLKNYKKWLPIVLLLFVILLFRVHNFYEYDPFRGYDAGGHIHYVLAVAFDNRIPSVEENYMAWHEPLYYVITGTWVKLTTALGAQQKDALLSLMFAQTVLSLFVTYLIFRLSITITKKKKIALLTAGVLSFMPGLTQTSIAPTSEILNYIFILLLLIVYYRSFLSKKAHPNIKHYILIGLIGGLGLITKVTMLIPLSIVILGLIVNWYRNRKKISGKYIFATLGLIAAIFAPWYIYRVNNVLSGFSVNNYEFNKPVPLAIDERVDFYTNIDMDIFVFPYWYSGGRSFWSMLYADTFYDYYNILSNQDLLKEKKPDDLVRTTINDTYVEKYRADLAKVVVWLAILPFMIMLFGFFTMAMQSLKKTFPSKASIGLLVTLGFLAGAIYYSYRYPHYDLGAVKSVFIYPMYVFLLAFGLRGISIYFKKTKKIIWVIVTTGLIIYFAFLIPTIWI